MPLSLPAKLQWVETETGAGKVAVSVGSDKMLILPIHPFFEAFQNTLWADVSFV